MLDFLKKKEADTADLETERSPEVLSDDLPPLEQAQSFRSAIMPVMACGAGLFSDGYINNVIGSVSTILAKEYGDVYNNSNAKKYVSDIAFAGTVVGQLIFGWLADHWRSACSTS
ncbi:hypothetical protein VTK73DRAFT_3752 [Phialemonium thermophilum]|uniref:Major facilitator superfamily (MFS) profile domain-containing protein n=1 Tax=Phialemonium thermophilum TaxID=223376 RepID=A0ABR3VG92_9PEZI